MPQNASSLAVYYNVDAFRKAGVPRARRVVDATSEFAAAAEQLTGDGRHGVGIDVSADPHGAVDLGRGRRAGRRRGPAHAVRCSTRPRAAAGSSGCSPCAAKGWSPTADEADAKPVEERFLEGSVAMFMSSRRDVPLLRSITGFEWDVAPFPTDVEPASVLHSDGFCVAKGADTDAAWSWIEFALGPEGQEVLAALGPQRAVAAGGGGVARLPRSPATRRRARSVFLDALEQMHRLPTTENWIELEQRADDILAELYYGRLEIDEALERLARETDGKF